MDELVIKVVAYGLVFLIGIISVVRLANRNSKVQEAGKNTASKLADGTIDISEVAAGLDINIRTKTVANAGDLTGFIQKVDAISTIPPKYNFHRIERGILGDAVFIADGIFKETIVVDGKISYKDIHYNCWLYILVSPHEHKVEFYGQLPHDKEHQYLLEDLADHIFEKAIAMQPNQVINRV